MTEINNTNSEYFSQSKMWTSGVKDTKKDIDPLEYLKKEVYPDLMKCYEQVKFQ